MRASLGEMLRFGSVGLAATAVHAGVYALLVSSGAVWPQISNLVAFAVAFVFSFLGHHYFTFRNSGRSAGSAAARFLLVALIGYGLNAGFVALTTEVLAEPPLVAVLFMLFVTPVVTYVLSKLWAFADRPAGTGR
ncbi:MAG: GtrA family protein [Rhizobiaceae bacterium]|nr:GtrA family protein [Rhizobiaceae bacterium]